MLREVLVIFQFTVAITLMISTIVIFKQLNYIQQQNEGYNRSQIFSVTLPGKWFDKHKEVDKEQIVNTFKQELLANTSIENATLTSGSLVNIMMSMSGIVDWNGKDPDFNPTVSIIFADTDFHDIFNLNVKEGGWFQPNSIQDKHNYIVNETALATFNLHPPYIGKRLTVLGDTGQIVGVVKDFHYRSYREKVGPIIILNKQSGNNLFIKTAPGQIPKALQFTRATWKNFFPQEPFESQFLDDAFAQLYLSDTRTSKLIGLFACVAIIICCLGLFGLVISAVEQRNKEIAIHKVLGASILQVMKMLSKDFVKLVFISIIIATPIAWWAMNNWLQDFAYRINISWWIFVIAGFAALLIALITISFKAIKAAIANPVKSLRSDKQVPGA